MCEVFPQLDSLQSVMRWTERFEGLMTAGKERLSSPFSIRSPTKKAYPVVRRIEEGVLQPRVLHWTLDERNLSKQLSVTTASGISGAALVVGRLDEGQYSAGLPR